MVFHFWDELPEEHFDLEITLDEFHLFEEAMNIFNKLKPDVTLFEDHVIRYRFTNTSGDFDFKKIPVSEYIADAVDKVVRLEKLEQRLDIVCSVVALLGGALVFLGFIMVFKESPAGWLKNISVNIAAASAGIVGWYTWNKLYHIPKHIEPPKKIKKKLESLKKQLKEINDRAKSTDGSESHLE